MRFLYQILPVVTKKAWLFNVISYTFEKRFNDKKFIIVNQSKHFLQEFVNSWRFIPIYFLKVSLI